MRRENYLYYIYSVTQGRGSGETYVWEPLGYNFQSSSTGMATLLIYELYKVSYVLTEYPANVIN